MDPTLPCSSSPRTSTTPLTTAMIRALFPDDGFTVYYDMYLQGRQGADPDTRMDYGLDKFGQLALMPVTHLDHEAAKNTYTIEVMDADAASELGVITVVITVTDVNEAPKAPAQHFGPAPSLNTAPEFQDANGDMATSTYRMVAENTAAGTAIGDPVEAMDADRGDTLSYELGGADAASFAIDSATGQLMTSAALDYETDMEYMVTVTATDNDGRDRHDLRNDHGHQRGPGQHVRRERQRGYRQGRGYQGHQRIPVRRWLRNQGRCNSRHQPLPVRLKSANRI